MVLETEESRPEEPWDTLPIDFLMKILRDHGLPVSTLVACRVVCKKWKEIVDGHDFRSKIWNKCVIVYDARTDGTAHFCCSNQWITKNITFPPKELVASDGGLLCFNEELSTEFVMYDPVPDKFLTLNVPYEIDGVATVWGGTIKWILVGLAVDQSTKSFKLLLGGVLSPNKRRSLMYDSTTGTWSWLAHRFPLSVRLGWQRGKSVACGGCLYWVEWDRLGHREGLVIFDLNEETWSVLERVLFFRLLQLNPGLHMTECEKLQIAAYEGHVCLLTGKWYTLDRDDLYNDVHFFFRNPMVRRLDGALIRRIRDVRHRTRIRTPRDPLFAEEVMDEDMVWTARIIWTMERLIFFRLYAAGSSDAFFMFETSGVDLQVAKYCAESDLIYFLPVPTFRVVPESRFWRDPWCAMIPTPGVSRQHEWTTQPQRHLEEEEELEVPRGEAAPEAQAGGGEDVPEGAGDEEAVESPKEDEQL